jgi:hypothetical protein
VDVVRFSCLLLCDKNLIFIYRNQLKINTAKILIPD